LGSTSHEANDVTSLNPFSPLVQKYQKKKKKKIMRLDMNREKEKKKVMMENLFGIRFYFVIESILNDEIKKKA
jgi:hypothetical protein